VDARFFAGIVVGFAVHHLPDITMEVIEVDPASFPVKLAFHSLISHGFEAILGDLTSGQAPLLT